MNIGIICYPTYGGSGIIATELGFELAKNGNNVHFISYDRPARLSRFMHNIYFHEVEIPNYPLFKFSPVTLSIAAKIAEVCNNFDIDILHAHYAIPHSICAYLAKEMIQKDVKIVTTLHGTDISVIGQDKSFIDMVKFGIDKSDAVTCVSEYLKELTYKEFNPNSKIDVVYNFIDTNLFVPENKSCEIFKLKTKDTKVIMHLSNFRNYKNVVSVIDVFNEILKKVKAILVLIGDGPEMVNVRKRAQEYKICDKIVFFGNQMYIESILPHGDLFLFPSLEESFGVALIEAMSCGVCPITSNVGGIPEVLGEDFTDFYYDASDVKGMAEKSVWLLSNKEELKKYSALARKRVLTNFDKVNKVKEYSEIYKRVLNN